MMRTRITLAAALLVAVAATAHARIKLTTLPERESVRIDIQNGRFTLVEEERTVNLQKGRNAVDFSWANIGIDKDSIVFRVIKADGEVNVLNTNYPPNENALYWTVSAENAGPAVIRISYLIGNMNTLPSYQGGDVPLDLHLGGRIKLAVREGRQLRGGRVVLYLIRHDCVPLCFGGNWPVPRNCSCLIDVHKVRILSTKQAVGSFWRIGDGNCRAICIPTK